jgi:hypothetical protein
MKLEALWRRFPMGQMGSKGETKFKFTLGFHVEPVDFASRSERTFVPQSG